jgi:hypothetical protein
MARIDKRFIPSPSTITCVLEINGTNYKKKKHFIYYESEGQRDSVIRLDAASNGSFKNCKLQLNFFCGLILMNDFLLSGDLCWHILVGFLIKFLHINN